MLDAVFIDSKGNKKNFLYQYDIGQVLTLEDFEYSNVARVDFQVKSLKTAIPVTGILKGNTYKVDIPDTLLTYGEDIITYVYIKDAVKGYVIMTFLISVVPRKVPSEKVYASEMYARSINDTIISANPSFAFTAEWEDGNPNGEDRSGYFVTVNYVNGKLVASKATSTDNVSGVSVSNVGFASGCDIDILDSKGNLPSNYTFVCQSGYASVIDNGTCSIDGICVPGSDGTAIRGTNKIGYKVLNRINDERIFIFVDCSMETVNTVNTNLTSHVDSRSNPHVVTKAQVGLGNCNNTSDANKPVSTAQAAAIKVVQDDIDAHEARTDNPHSVTKTQVGLGNCDNTSDVNKPVSTAQKTAIDTVQTNLTNHNVDTSAHNDIRGLITTLTTRLNTLADSDDTTLDQMSEVVAYIKNNKSLIDGITTSKVGVSDIIDNLITADSTKPLSANQGVEIKKLIDALQTSLDSKEDSLTFDGTPTLGSNNPVTSDGIFDALSDKANATDLATLETEISTINEELSKKATLGDDGKLSLDVIPDGITASGGGTVIVGGGSYTTTDDGDGNVVMTPVEETGLTIESIPTENSTNLVTSGGVYSYVSSQIGDIAALLDEINGEVV